MNLSILIETLEEMGNAIQASDLSRVETCRTFCLRILGAEIAPDISQCQTLLDKCDHLAAAHYRVHPRDLHLPGRTNRIAHPRQLAIYLGRCQGLTCEVIGRHYNRDHATVLHAWRAVQNRLDTEPAFAAAAQQMLDQLR